MNGAPICPEGLEAALRDALAALARVDHEYNQGRAGLERRTLSRGQKAYLRAQLEAKRRRDREPLVLRLADIHYRMMRATIFGSLAKPVPSGSALRGISA
jgi:hypothetical protein